MYRSHVVLESGASSPTRCGRVGGMSPARDYRQKSDPTQSGSNSRLAAGSHVRFFREGPITISIVPCHGNESSSLVASSIIHLICTFSGDVMCGAAASSPTAC